MNSTASGPSTDELLTARFNQDHTCLAVGTRRGYQIFACEPFASCHACADGAGIAVLEMLFSSSLVALVSAGERPGDSPRRLRLWNTRSNASICDLNFSTTVLAVRMNKARLLAVLESKLHIFELSTMKLLHTLETASNRLGLAELCADAETCHAVLPAAQPGQVLYFDALQLHALNTVQAHKSPLGCIALSSNGHLVATASEKGTVIRVSSFPQGALLHTFRRGSLPTTICSLSFSPGVLLGGTREGVRAAPPTPPPSSHAHTPTPRHENHIPPPPLLPALEPCPADEPSRPSRFPLTSQPARARRIAERHVAVRGVGVGHGARVAARRAAQRLHE